MKTENIAVIALIVIVAGALSAYLIATNGEELFSNFQGENEQPSQPVNTGVEGVVEVGDCIEVEYVGTYVNGTEFDASNGTPLKVFVTLDPTETAPSNYSDYSSGLIEGFMEGLIGKEIGKSYTITVPPEKGYGENKLDVGDSFKTSSFAVNTLKPELSLNQTLEVTDMDSNFISFKWVDFDAMGLFTMPQIILRDLQSQTYEDMILIVPPYFIWENTSEIISSTDDTVTVKTTPSDSTDMFNEVEQLPYGFDESDILFILPNATSATWNETHITLSVDPDVGDVYTYTQQTFYGPMELTLTIVSVTDDKVNISLSSAEMESQYMEINKSISFSRTFDLPRTYSDIPIQYAEQLIALDLDREGYSLHELAGETLIFEVTIEEVYKVS